MEKAIESLKNKLITDGAEAFDYQQLNGQDLTAESIVLKANVLPALSEHRLLIIENPSEEIFKNDTFLNYLDDPAPDTCLVLVIDGEIDKRKKAIKKISQQGEMVYFTSPKGLNFAKSLQRIAKEKGYNLPLTEAQLLANASNNDLKLANEELDKIITYVGDGPITSSVVHKLVSDTSTEKNIFQLVDALGNRKPTLAITILRYLLAKGEAPLRIVAMLARQLRLIYQVYLVKDKKELASRLGVKPFVAKKVLAQANNFTMVTVERALNELLKVDLRLKTGQGSPESLLEQALWTISLKREH
ncbi:MAG: polymerase subunit delta [Clostridia bacterium]|nr:polymerase subunit delta [Clostridia bacterium]